MSHWHASTVSQNGQKQTLALDMAFRILNKFCGCCRLCSMLGGGEILQSVNSSLDATNPTFWSFKTLLGIFLKSLTTKRVADVLLKPQFF